MHADKKKKKYTIIVIEDERRLCSFKLPPNFLMICIVVVIALGFISYAGFHLYNRMGFKGELAAGVGTPAKPSETSGSKEPEAATAANTALSSYNLSIENFEASFDLSRKLFRYSFLLKNKTTKSGPSSGYIFLILKSEAAGADGWFADPHTVLANGVPQNFRDGDPFSISRHKTITKDIAVQHAYDSAAIFVFSDEGKLVLREIFNLKT